MVRKSEGAGEALPPYKGSDILSEHAITLHVDFTEKVLTNLEGEITKAKIYLSSHVELKLQDYLFYELDPYHQPHTKGEWPEDLLNEIHNITVNLSRYGKNEGCNIPITQLSAHNYHAPQFHGEADMKKYMNRIEGDLGIAEEKLVCLVKEYYENISEVETYHSTSEVKEYADTIYVGEKQGQEFLDATPDPAGATHGVIVCECGNKLMVLPGTMLATCICGNVFNLPAGWTLDGTIELIEPAGSLAMEFLEEIGLLNKTENPDDEEETD